MFKPHITCTVMALLAASTALMNPTELRADPKPQLGIRLAINPQENQALVIKVERGHIADVLGIEVGDELLLLNNTPINQVRDVLSFNQNCSNLRRMLFKDRSQKNAKVLLLFTTGAWVPDRTKKGGFDVDSNKVTKVVK